jgi:glutamine---fructose-6-phosphate transaminase (isomerizing)
MAVARSNPLSQHHQLSLKDEDASMSGIIGYIGRRKAAPILLDGLRNLEGNGYDSAGLAILAGRKVKVEKGTGSLEQLEAVWNGKFDEGSSGLGHLRWATHGIPSNENAHPHLDCEGAIAVVHNGVIENFQMLKTGLLEKNHRFVSDTDSEVLAHLIEKYFQGDLEEAIRRAFHDVKGNYSAGVISDKDPQKLIGVSSGYPLIIGLGKEEIYLASDSTALAGNASEQILLDHGEMAVLTRGGVRVTGLYHGRAVLKTVRHIRGDTQRAERGGYSHFLLKEIHEQPQIIKNALTRCIGPSGEEIVLPEVPSDIFKGVERVRLVGGGSSYHAALLGKYYWEKLINFPVEVTRASEWPYRKPEMGDKTLTISVSRSGELMDPLDAMMESPTHRSPMIAICDAPDKRKARKADGIIYTGAGQEFGLTSTKSFTSQVACLILLALHAGRETRQLTQNVIRNAVKILSTLPDLMTVLLVREKEIQQWSNRFWDARDFLLFGRGPAFPVALEGALNLKEVSCLHAEGYPTGEIKQGPIALINDKVPVMVLAPQGLFYERDLKSLDLVKSRNGIVLALGTEGDKEIQKRSDYVFYLPPTDDLLIPFLMAIPLQLLAYYIGSRRGLNVDQPVDLAKSVPSE